MATPLEDAIAYVFNYLETIADPAIKVFWLKENGKKLDQAYIYSVNTDQSQDLKVLNDAKKINTEQINRAQNEAVWCKTFHVYKNGKKRSAWHYFAGVPEDLTYLNIFKYMLLGFIIYPIVSTLKYFFAPEKIAEPVILDYSESKSDAFFSSNCYINASLPTLSAKHKEINAIALAPKCSNNTFIKNRHQLNLVGLDYDELTEHGTRHGKPIQYAPLR